MRVYQFRHIGMARESVWTRTGVRHASQNKARR